MGALTHKFVFLENRTWASNAVIIDDLLDSFSSSIKILLSNNQIILIEPNTLNKIYFISNKSRQFFDILKFDRKYLKISNLFNILNNIEVLLYLFFLNYLQNKHVNFFIIFFENITIEILSIFSFIEQLFFFIKIVCFSNKKVNNDFEIYFKFNKMKLKQINNVLTIGLTLESNYLNLKLKQRSLKGNFKYFNLGSCFDYPYKILNLGSFQKILKFIIEGSIFICQDLIKNFLILINSEFYIKKNIKYNILLNFYQLANCSINILNSSIYETGVYFLNNFLNITEINIVKLYLIYFINVLELNENKFIIKMLKFKFFYLFHKKNKKIYNFKYLYLNHTYLNNIKNFFYLPVKNCYESSELFFNNYADLRNTTQILSSSKKSSWKLVRFIFNFLKKSFKQKLFLWLNLKNLNCLKLLFLIFLPHYFLLKKNLLIKNNSFVIFLNLNKIAFKRIKIYNTKIHYWLNDYYLDGKDGFTKFSINMIKSSLINRLNFTNFF